MRLVVGEPLRRAVLRCPAGPAAMGPRPRRFIHQLRPVIFFGLIREREPTMRHIEQEGSGGEGGHFAGEGEALPCLSAILFRTHGCPRPGATRPELRIWANRSAALRQKVPELWYSSNAG